MKFLHMRVSALLLNGIFIGSILLSKCIYATDLTIVTEHLAPFQIVDKDKITGISTEIVKKTLDEAKFNYKIEALPWALSFNLAKREKNTCIYSIGRIPIREPLFNWIGHIISASTSFYSLASKQLKISSLEDTKNYKTAVIREDVAHHFLLSQGFVEGDNLYVMDNYDALLELLEKANRNIDLVVLNDELIFHRVKSTQAATKYKKVYNLKELTLDFHLACSLNTEQNIVDKLQNTMRKLERNGTFSSIRKKYSSNLANLL
ncbi:ABC transporter substrate-binding protein [uncultured Paraglaciecola sp.]|uniref:substrate-binding periplasmic protein n=1 Tax=uncultured Paraglaciecola sp. TaxID=1765024 RepID=UPI0026259BE8|nr:transporter substrate-binding domain-containing protein [uncultured Paraglaciecola sp.]